MDAVVKPWPKPAVPEPMAVDHARTGAPPSAPKPSREDALAAVRTLIAYAGDNPDREGLLDTPRRVVDAYDELYRGYGESPAEVLDRTFGEIGDLRRFRAGARHRLQLALRAPHDAVRRQGAYRLQAGRPRGGAVEARAAGRSLCLPPADAGAHDVADRHRARGLSSAPAASPSCSRPSTCACRCAASRSRVLRPSPRSSPAASATIRTIRSVSSPWCGRVSADPAAGERNAGQTMAAYEARRDRSH